MPIHDWTRVSSGIFHDFHLAWTSELRTTLNDGLLPPDYYAQAEQIVGPFGPDVLTLGIDQPGSNGTPRPSSSEGGIALATATPRARLVNEADYDEYVQRRRTLTIRHTSGDRIVALIEIISPGNKGSSFPFLTFVDKAIMAVRHGYHMLIIDLFPPTPRDPNGIHAAIWGAMTTGTEPFVPPEGEPLALVAYSASRPVRAFIEPTAVGKELLEMPLFLEPERYIEVPLEETYMAAYRGVPRRWKAVLEA